VRGDQSQLLLARGQLAEAEQARRDSLHERVALYGDDHWQTAFGRVQLAVVLYERGSYDEALALAQRALPVLRANAAKERYMLISALTTFANSAVRCSRSDEALEAYQEAIERAVQAWGEEDPETLGIRNSRAALLMNMRRLDEAERIFDELRQVLARVCGEGHSKTIRAASNHALCAERRGAFAEAEQRYRRILSIRQQADNKTEPSDLITHFNLCVAMHRQDDPTKVAAAAAELDALIADAGRLLPADNWRLAVFRQHKGIVLTKLGRFAEAEGELAAARAVLEQRLGKANARTRSNYEETANLYEAWGRPDEAASFRARLEAK
jgi:tetratricopeptide (TPR) repeat protein